ncbi:hypothetical protein [Maritalea sp.]|jgi:hypothetical protein|uniref:hypothetical protein n=1 Tax=Maritalea sp. TaxID=2003361 RepID=UPI0039E57AB7
MNIITRSFAVAGFVAASLLGTTAYAQSGSGGEFTLFNDTAGNVVVGFYTNDGNGWSANWLADQMSPGESASAEFFAETGACDQLFQVGWLGGDGSEVMDEPISIDVCQASNVYLGDNEIKFD